MRLLPMVRDVKASMVRTAAPLMPSDTFGMADDDGIVEEFADQLFRAKHMDILHAVVLRAAVKALVSGLVHHVLTDANGVLLNAIGLR